MDDEMMTRQEELYGRAARFVVRARSAEIRARRGGNVEEALRHIHTHLDRVMSMGTGVITQEQRQKAVMKIHAIEADLENRDRKTTFQHGPGPSGAGRGGLHPDIRPIKVTREAMARLLEAEATKEERQRTVKLLAQHVAQKKGATYGGDWH